MMNGPYLYILVSVGVYVAGYIYGPFCNWLISYLIAHLVFVSIGYEFYN